MSKTSYGYIQARRLLGRGESWETTGQVQEIEVDETLLFSERTLGVNPDVLGVYNLDGGDADSEYGGTTGFDGGGA